MTRRTGLCLLALGAVFSARGAVPAAPELDVVKVRDNIYMLVGPAENTTVAFGTDGVMIVNTQSEACLLYTSRCV